MMSRAPGGPLTRTSTRDSDRDINTEGHRENYAPVVVAAAEQLGRELGYRIRLRNVARIYARWDGEHDFLSYCLTYLDPTGETATYRADAAGGAACERRKPPANNSK